MPHFLKSISVAQIYSINILTICLGKKPKQGSNVLVLFRYIWLPCSNSLTHKNFAQNNGLKLFRYAS